MPAVTALLCVQEPTQNPLVCPVQAAKSTRPEEEVQLRERIPEKTPFLLGNAHFKSKKLPKFGTPLPKLIWTLFFKNERGEGGYVSNVQ